MTNQLRGAVSRPLRSDEARSGQFTKPRPGRQRAGARVHLLKTTRHGRSLAPPRLIERPEGRHRFDKLRAGDAAEAGLAAWGM
jgi:hypothetical protein